ncbi:hypothetical protein AFA91_20500 [Mycolicibacterium goodii]|uniref:Methyltransferase domain-containing protein n=2 Tax=Mycolicibacterium goodii TaxID=134601 RepID=A0A0K0X902_MYCGD|nr:hypothetical protein AFA91_20500 [Mycolicibacterium goodii]
MAARWSDAAENQQLSTQTDNPPAFVDDLVVHLSLDGTGRLLDLGCGTGQLTLPLARHVTEAVGIDPESGMLAEADRHARERGVTNVTWFQGSSEQLPAGLGHFRLVTMGRSFHWMNRQQVLAALDETVDDGGSVVIANDSCLVLPTTPWQQAIEEVQKLFLNNDRVGTARTRAWQTHEQILAKSPFRHVRRQVYEFERTWTVEQAIGYLYSTSLPLRRLLGDRRSAFEDKVTAALLDIDSSGYFIEPVSLEVLIATRDPNVTPAG